MSAEVTSLPQKPITRSPWMLIPPPLLFVLAFIVGLQLNRLFPLPLLPQSLSNLTRGLGVVLIVLGALLSLGCVALFANRRTTIIPHDRARSLVTFGPYRVTRNPMYVGLTLVYLGVCLLANTVWPVPFLALPLWVLETKVIPFEEQTLTQVFGSEYTAYAARVRRWL